MEINKDMFYPYYIYDKPIPYTNELILYPIHMDKILEFTLFSKVLTIMKDSLFNEKRIVKMEYFEFIKFLNMNKEFATKYDNLDYCLYYMYLMNLFELVFKDSEIKYSKETLDIYINNVLITNEIFDDIRKIIIWQNDIDFDVDEFINKDTYDALQDAKKKRNKNKDNVSIEDLIDSLIVSLKMLPEDVERLSIRKFYRLISRSSLYDSYKINKSAEMSGFVTFKEEIKDWKCSLDIRDKYADLKTDRESLDNKMG